MAAATAIHTTRVPIVATPDAQLSGDGDGPLRSVADSGVLLLSLRESRNAILSTVFTKFLIEGKLVQKPGEPTPPPHVVQTLGECTLEVGPHTFLTVFYEITYPAPTVQQAPLPHLSSNILLQPTIADTLKALDPSLDLSLERVQQITTAASTNVTLSHLLALATERRASKDQEQMLGLLVKSLPKPLTAVSGSSTPAKRGPGRPPKPKPVSVSVNKGASSSTIPASSGHEQIMHNISMPSSADVKRGPGRPPKTQHVSDNEAAASVVPKKRGPGRPRKYQPQLDDGSRQSDKPSQPKKRGPGRPRKNSRPPLSDSEYEGDPSTPPPVTHRLGRSRTQKRVSYIDDSESDSPSLSVRRGPGRSEKFKTQSDDAGSISASSSARPKQHGRLPKASLEDNAEDTAQEKGYKERELSPKAKSKSGNQEDSPPSKRGHGRPRAVMLIDTSSEDDQQSSHDYTQVSKKNISESDGERSHRNRSSKSREKPPSSLQSQPVKRRRGRPAKSKTHHEPVASPPDEGEDDVIPKRRRGRPPKATPLSNLDDTTEHIASADVPVKRRPGRPRKNKSSERAGSPSGIGEEHSVTKILSNVAYSAPVKRGPGRPPKPRPIPRAFDDRRPITPAPSVPPAESHISYNVVSLPPSEAVPGAESAMTQRFLRQSDIVFEFKEIVGVMWLLPTEPVLYEVAADDILLITTVQANNQTQSSATPASTSSVVATPSHPNVQLLRIRLKGLPNSLQRILEQRANNEEQSLKAKRTFMVQKPQSVPRTYPSFQLHEGSLLDQIQSAVFPQPVTIPLKPYLPPVPKRKRRLTAKGDEPSKRRRRVSTIHKCQGCNAPLQSNGRFCLECKDTEKTIAVRSSDAVVHQALVADAREN